MIGEVDSISLLDKAGEALKLPSYLEEILQQVQKKVGCEVGSILLLGDKKDELVFKVTTGTKGGEIRKLRVKIKEGVAGWVFQKGQSLIVNNTLRDKRFSRRFDRSTNFSTKSILAVPLKIGDNVVGVIELLNKKGEDFTREDLNDVLSFASLASTVIENVELYKYLRILVNKVKNLENYQKVLLESLTDGVLSINASNEIVSCNKSIQLMLNQDKNFLIGKDISTIFDSENSIKKIINSCTEKGAVKDLFCYLKKAQNERIAVAIDASLLHYDGSNKGSVIVVRNLNSALNIAEMVRETILKSDLVPNLSHEFKTPLTAIQAGIQIMKTNKNKNGNRKYIEIIDNNIGILKERIQSFLDYLKAEKDKWEVRPERIILPSLLEEKVKVLRKRFPQYGFSLSLPDLPVYISADRAQIEKVLSIIFKNAIQYSEEGSEIKTKVIQNKSSVNLYIEDKGRGISSKNIEYIFDKFKRFSEPLKETTSGLGIGLWLAKYLLNKNNAGITVKSKEGEGTVVNISFRNKEKYNE